MPSPGGRRPGPLRRWWKSPRVREVRHRLEERWLFPLVGALCRVWYRLLHRGVRYDRRGPLFPLLQNGRPCIVALWHQDVFPLMFELFRYTSAGSRTLFLVSPGSTGRLGSYLLGLWGIECVAGSGSQRGVQAVEELAARARKECCNVFLMADGSRGPARQARFGPVYLARDSGLPLVAVRAWGDNLVTLRRTWMRLVLPKPWGRAVFLSAVPLRVLPDADREALDGARRELQSRLNALADAAERYFREGPEAVEAFGPDGSVRGGGSRRATRSTPPPPGSDSA